MLRPAASCIMAKGITEMDTVKPLPIVSSSFSFTKKYHLPARLARYGTHLYACVSWIEKDVVTSVSKAVSEELSLFARGLYLEIEDYPTVLEPLANALLNHIPSSCNLEVGIESTTTKVSLVKQRRC